MRIARFLPLAVLVGVVAVAAQAPRPSYLDAFPAARSRSEAVALGYINTVQNAQADYRKRRGRYAGSLSALINYGSFTRRMARTDRRDYTVTFRGGSGGYSVQMIPKVFEPTRRSFYSDQGGVVRVAEDAPADADSPVLKPDSESSAASAE